MAVLATYELAHLVPGSICLRYKFVMHCSVDSLTELIELTKLTWLLLCPQKPLSRLPGYFLVMVFNQSLKDTHIFFQTLAYEQQKKLMGKLWQDWKFSIFSLVSFLSSSFSFVAYYKYSRYILFSDSAISHRLGDNCFSF